MSAPVLVESAGDLSIIAATPALLDAEDEDSAGLARLLGVRPPQIWPPEHNDAATRAWMRDLFAQHPDEPGFGSWYIVVGGRLVGICGYKGPPDAAGQVEVGYSVIEPEQRQGFGTGAVRLLVERAFRDPRVTAVAAETLPSLLPSQKVLERCGFALVSRRVEEEVGEVLRFEKPRP